MNPVDIIMQIFGYLGAIGISLVSFPELINLIKTRKTYHINVILFGMITFASICFVISGFYNFVNDISSKKEFNASIAFSLAIAVANVISGIIGGTVLTVKLIHMIKARKKGISEEEYYNQFIKKK